MDDEFDTIPMFLFVKNIYLNDCKRIDQFQEEQLLGDGFEVDVEIESKLYDVLPFTYEGLHSWPLNTNIWCWYCNKAFDGVPIFIPKNIEPNIEKSGFTMYREGCFSSFPCAAAYIDREYPRISDNSEKKNMLKFLYQNMMGTAIIDIPSAPSKFLMKHYGGNMDVNQFDKIVRDMIPTHREELESKDNLESKDSH